MTAAPYSHYVLQMLDGSFGMKIRTEHVFPPIPNRNFDWSAIDDNTYDGPDSPMGVGPTEQAAITDLLRQVLDYKLLAIQRKVDKVMA